MVHRGRMARAVAVVAVVVVVVVEVAVVVAVVVYGWYDGAPLSHRRYYRGRCYSWRQQRVGDRARPPARKEWCRKGGPY